LLFQVTHTHDEDTCPGVHSDKLKTFGDWWQALKTNANVKVLGGYVSPMEHIFHITLEADDFGTVARALGPLNSIGSGRICPVLTLDQALPLAESGAFRPT
jgi:hypothetical protein